jgi:hypothetical protein
MTQQLLVRKVEIIKQLTSYNLILLSMFQFKLFVLDENQVFTLIHLTTLRKTNCFEAR